MDDTANAGRRERRGQLAARLEALRHNRAAQASTIDKAEMGLYERIRPARKGLAVVKLDGPLCTGCRVTLPTQDVQRVRAGTDIITCPHCNRILVPHG